MKESFLVQTMIMPLLLFLIKKKEDDIEFFFLINGVSLVAGDVGFTSHKKEFSKV